MKNIYEIGDEFDSIIEKESKTSTSESLVFLYQRSYEGLKSSVYSFIGNLLQSEKF